jgi:SdpC family antimicrobial peptide
VTALVSHRLRLFSDSPTAGGTLYATPSTTMHIITVMIVIGVVPTLCIGCNSEENTSERFASFAASSPFGAEELFRGLVLGDGPIAQAVPEIRDHTGLDAQPLSDAQRAQVRAAYDGLMADIIAEHADFLEWFALEIASGDHYRVTEALRQGGDLMLTTLRIDSEANLVDDVTRPREEGVLAVIFAAVHVAVAVHVWAAVHHTSAVTTFAYKYVAIETDIGIETNTRHSLLGEQMVDSIVRHVSPRASAYW